MIGLFCGLALAGKWDGKPSDVVASQTIQAPPSAVYGVITNLDALGEAWADECISEWVVSGSRVTVKYAIGVFKRRVPAVLANLVPDRSVDLEHEGRRGFTTRWKLEPAGDGTLVTMTTFLSAPPWPVTGTYFTTVKPEWEACQADVLAGIAAISAGGGASAP